MGADLGNKTIGLKRDADSKKSETLRYPEIRTLQEGRCEMNTYKVSYVTDINITQGSLILSDSHIVFTTDGRLSDTTKKILKVFQVFYYSLMDLEFIPLMVAKRIWFFHMTKLLTTELLEGHFCHFFGSVQ